ncbi:MAG: hypothetical protein VXW65_14090 [Pseudomonadota bacterium]|nr:hypothetical protein [Pseudomonadota bacterium]
MFATLALGAFETLFNQWIDLDAATRLGFDQLHGKQLRIVTDAPQLSVDVWFDHGRVRLSPTPLGMAQQPQRTLFEQRPYDPQYSPTQADTTLHVPHLVALARLAGSTPGTTGNVPIQGDLALIQQLQRIMAQAEPDATSVLAPWLGHGLAQQLSLLLSEGKRRLQNTQHGLAAQAEKSLSAETGLFAPRWQAERFVDGVRDLRNDIERLQARLERLTPDDTQPPAPQPHI